MSVYQQRMKGTSSKITIECKIKIYISIPAKDENCFRIACELQQEREICLFKKYYTLRTCLVK